MANIREKTYAEMENIKRVLGELEKVKGKPTKDVVVLVGIGAYLHNIYTGMENILKQLLLHKNISIDDTATWHMDLLKFSIENSLITKETADEMISYLGFRHFFIHAYGFLIEEGKLEPLMSNISPVYAEFKREVELYLTTIEE